MPALEMAQETGKLIAWRKKEGDRVTKGEPLLEIETDKAVVEVEAPADGILAGIKASEGSDIPVGQTIAWIVAPGETPPVETESTTPAARAGSHAKAESSHVVGNGGQLGASVRLPARRFLPRPAASPKNWESILRRCAPPVPVERFLHRMFRRQPSAPAASGAPGEEIRKHRSAQFARPHHGGAHHAELDHRPSLLRQPRDRSDCAQPISRKHCC